MNWFTKIVSSNTTANAETGLVFKDCEAAFAHACKWMDCTLGEGTSVPAIVVDSREFASDIGCAVKTESDKSQLAMIRVASKNGGFGSIQALDRNVCSSPKVDSNFRHFLAT